MHTAPFTNYTAYGTLQTAYCTLCTAGVLWLAVHALSRQYIEKVIEHVWYNDPLYTLRAADCTLHTSMAHCTLHTAHYTLPWHTALYKVHAALWWARNIWPKLTYASNIPVIWYTYKENAKKQIVSVLLSARDERLCMTSGLYMGRISGKSLVIIIAIVSGQQRIGDRNSLACWWVIWSLFGINGQMTS